MQTRQTCMLLLTVLFSDTISLSKDSKLVTFSTNFSLFYLTKYSFYCFCRAVEGNGFMLITAIQNIHNSQNQAYITSNKQRYLQTYNPDKVTFSGNFSKLENKLWKQLGFIH